MKGDFTRDTFDPVKSFSRVLMQQGRVQLDADWNEQTSILLHYVRTLAADILGPHAGPTDAMGFDLITSEAVQAWITNGLDPEAQWGKIEPDPERRRILRKAVEVDNDVAIDTGRYYVQGVLVENHRPILCTEQAGYPFSPETELPNLKGKEWVAYLDVWERHITYVEDDHIREVALGGADTCSRAQVVWQVKHLLRGNQDAFDCDSVESLLARKNLPKLRARAQHGTASPEVCSVSPESQYRGLENHLYRVEIHEVDIEALGGGKDKNKKPRMTATFKWSRENGSIGFPIVSLSGDTVVVANLGRDQCAQLKAGDWVEVCDDELALREQSGPLALVVRVDRDEMKVTLKWPAGVTVLPSYAEGQTPSKHPLLRLWNHAGELVAYHGALPIIESAMPDEGWMELEDGVQIWFAEGVEYRVGDYWLIPARVATGNIEWPARLDNEGVPQLNKPAELSPHGPKHYYAPLYQGGNGDPGTVDCRCTVTPARTCVKDK